VWSCGPRPSKPCSCPPYFQIVFTLPAQLHAFFRRAPAVCLTLLFEAVAETLADVARTKLKATLGFTLVLHTWNQRLGFHPHLHCVGPPAASRSTPRIGSRPPGASSCPSSGSASSSAQSCSPSSSGRCARARSSDSSTRTWPCCNAHTKYRTVSGPDFSRLFLQHVLPPRFVRIRHYGLLAARRRHNLALCRELLGAPPVTPPEKDANWALAFERRFGTNPLRCPAGKTGVLVATRVLPPLRA